MKKSSQNTLRKTVLAFMISIFISGTLFLHTFHAPLFLFPDNETYFEFATMVDADLAEGNSTASIDTSDGLLSLNFQLGEAGEKPFAMMVFHDLDLVRNYDIAPYDSLHFHMNENHTTDFSITLYMYIPGFSDPALTNTHRPYRFDVRAHSGEKEMSIALNNFATPGWWFTQFTITEEKLPPTDWSKFTHMTISSFAHEKSRTPLSLSFEEISFRTSPMQAPILSLTLFLGAFLLLQFLFTNKRLPLRIKNEVPTPHTRKTTPEESEKLLVYLAKEYPNPLLSLDRILKDLQLNAFQVHLILQETYQIPYKEYLTTLRLNKAKELLLKSELPVGVIAEQVGYVYANSFSRTFKQNTGITPQQFRKSTPIE